MLSKVSYILKQATFISRFYICINHKLVLGVIATHPSLTPFLIPKNPIDIFFQIYTGAAKTQLSWNDAQKWKRY
ncbi:MAG: hypothetical protein ACXW07_09290, partial [Nitrososphaeraceae archaeon]